MKLGMIVFLLRNIGKQTKSQCPRDSKPLFELLVKEVQETPKTG